MSGFGRAFEEAVVVHALRCPVLFLKIPHFSGTVLLSLCTFNRKSIQKSHSVKNHIGSTVRLFTESIGTTTLNFILNHEFFT